MPVVSGVQDRESLAARDRRSNQWTPSPTSWSNNETDVAHMWQWLKHFILKQLQMYTFKHFRYQIKLHVFPKVTLWLVKMANLLKFGFLRRKRVDGLMQHFCSYMFSANYHELCMTRDNLRTNEISYTTIRQYLYPPQTEILATPLLTNDNNWVI